MAAGTNSTDYSYLINKLMVGIEKVVFCTFCMIHKVLWAEV